MILKISPVNAVTAGGTSQEVTDEWPGRSYLLVQNQSAGPLWVGFDRDAVAGPPSVKLAASGTVGDRLEFAGGIAPQHAINILGATTAQAFVVVEG